MSPHLLESSLYQGSGPQPSRGKVPGLQALDPSPRGSYRLFPSRHPREKKRPCCGGNHWGDIRCSPCCGPAVLLLAPEETRFVFSLTFCWSPCPVPASDTPAHPNLGNSHTTVLHLPTPALTDTLILFLEMAVSLIGIYSNLLSLK